MIVTVASQKGGVGKSTIAMNLALGMAGLKAKFNIALIDADEQKSCMETLEGNNDRKNLTLYETIEKPHRLINQIKNDYKMIVVDIPPHTHTIMYQAAAVSDLVLIPLQPSPLDIRGVRRTVEALEIIKKDHAPSLKCRFLINRVSPRTILSGEIKEVLSKFYPYPVLETVLHNREAYKQSLITGLSVIEHSKKSEAAKELGNLLIEIGTILKK